MSALISKILGIAGFIWAKAIVPCPNCRGIGHHLRMPTDAGPTDPPYREKCRRCGGFKEVTRWRWVWDPWAR